MNWTISRVAAKYGLSRSTLLYYHGIGLLSPARRSAGNYRLYSEKDLSLLSEICRLRNAGVPLQEIKRVLNSGTLRRTAALRRRLEDINNEISRLRRQQRIVIDLLDTKEIVDDSRILTKEKWISYLQSAGLDQAGMERWHYEFETCSPEAHQDFLESLGLSEAEIREIRRQSRSLAGS